MNNPQIASGLWRKQKARLKLMFSTLTDDDFKYDYGMKELMMTRLQEKLGKSRSDINEVMTTCDQKKSQLKYFPKQTVKNIF